MLRLVGAIVVFVASYASILGLYFAAFPSTVQPPWWGPVGLAALGLVTASVAIWEIYDYWKLLPRKIPLHKQAKINQYMREFLSSGGRAVIFTRDMSWARADGEQKTRDLLIEKARKHELTICIQNPIDLTNMLSAEGADIVAYAELGHVPRSRFTIMDFDRDGSRVAVGGAVGKYHVIQEYRMGEHPFFSVAEDFARLLMKYKQDRDAARER